MENKNTPIPKYIDCKSKYITKCDWYMHKSCPSTCGYALDIGGLGIGAPTEPPRTIKQSLVDKLNKIIEDKSKG